MIVCMDDSEWIRGGANLVDRPRHDAGTTCVHACDLSSAVDASQYQQDASSGKASAVLTPTGGPEDGGLLRRCWRAAVDG